MPYKQRLNSWIIVRLLPNLQRRVVGWFRSWSDADGQIGIWRQLLASDRLIVVFDPGDRRAVSPVGRNRVFYRNSAFKALTLVKNPVSLVFMRKS